MYQLLPKTIQIFLPNGDPQGIRVAEITTRIVRVVEVPRSKMSEFLDMPEAKQVGIYLLIGESEDTGAPQIYVGQSGSVGGRLVDHNKKKDFWGRALIVVSLTNSLTNTHATYLEWLWIKLATECARYQLENGNAGARPHTPKPLEADCQEIHETAAILVATLGHPVFEPLTKADNRSLQEAKYFSRSSGANGQGLYTEEGFVVLKGSSGRLETVPSYATSAGIKVRQRLLDQGILKQEGDRVVFQRDHLFNSPSTAAQMLVGRTANGWIEWKDARGVPLDALRQVDVGACDGAS
jgi:hypothetical protein